jgi:hypothetical protein
VCGRVLLERDRQVVYGMSNLRLFEFTGDDPTHTSFALSCRVIASAVRAIPRSTAGDDPRAQFSRAGMIEWAPGQAMCFSHGIHLPLTRDRRVRRCTRIRRTVTPRNTAAQIRRTPGCGGTPPSHIQPSSEPVYARTCWGSIPLSSTTKQQGAE